MPHLIQYGWDVQDTSYWRTNSLAREAIEPFSGTVIKFMDGATNLGRTAWGAVAYNSGDFAASAADLAATNWLKWDHNFAQICTDTAIDLYEDWTNTLANVELVAQAAYDGGLRGIMIDPEPYGTEVWKYSDFDAGRKAAHTFNEYKVKANARGSEFIQAINAGFPGAVLWCLYGPWYPAYWRTILSPEDVIFSLWFEFVEGMFEEMDSNTILIDGYESSYGYRTALQFQGARDTVLSLPISAFSPAAAAKAASQLDSGFGIWLDNQSGTYPWDAVDLSNNWFAPQELAQTMRLAWAYAGENGYVWLYNQTPRWRGAGSPMQTNYATGIATALRTPDLSGLVARTHDLP